MALSVALVALALVLPSLGSPAGPPARPRSTARIEILSPTEGRAFHGTQASPAEVPVRLRVLGARIVPATSTRLRPDEGHIHLFLDGSLISMTGGTTATVQAVPGSHVLTAEFVATDHGPFDPRIRAEVRFTVQA